MTDHLPILIVILPLMTALLISVAGWWNRSFAGLLSLGCMGGCTIVSVFIWHRIMSIGQMTYNIGGWPPPMGIALKMDHLSALMLALVSFMGMLTAVYAGRTLEKELPDRIFLFWVLFLLLVCSLNGIIISADLFNLFVLLEVASLTGYALVASGGKMALVAGFRYLLIGTIGACFYLLGVGYLYLATGTLNMADLAALLPDLYQTRMVGTALIFIFTGLAIKMALFPFHAWQPDAYTYAPSAVSIIISTAVAKTYIYALIRILFDVFGIDYINTMVPGMTLICWMAALAIILGSVLAIWQDNLKRVLAYSSITNIGYILLGIGLASRNSLGLAAPLLHMINHTIIKGAMFMAAGSFMFRFHLIRISDFQGLSRKMPVMSMVLILSSLAMIGLPPGGGFVSKWLLVLAAVDAGNYAFVAAIFISTLLMLVYFWRIIETLYIKPAKIEANGPFSSHSPSQSVDMPLSMTTPAILLAFLSFFTGLIWMAGWMDPMVLAINRTFGLGGDL